MDILNFLSLFWLVYAGLLSTPLFLPCFNHLFVMDVFVSMDIDGQGFGVHDTFAADVDLSEYVGSRKVVGVLGLD
jgi:hypothetical protein